LTTICSKLLPLSEDGLAKVPWTRIRAARRPLRFLPGQHHSGNRRSPRTAITIGTRVVLQLRVPVSARRHAVSTLLNPSI